VSLDPVPRLVEIPEMSLRGLETPDMVSSRWFSKPLPIPFRLKCGSRSVRLVHPEMHLSGWVLFDFKGAKKAKSFSRNLGIKKKWADWPPPKRNIV
jgi:hypothetical protein